MLSYASTSTLPLRAFRTAPILSRRALATPSHTSTPNPASFLSMSSSSDPSSSSSSTGASASTAWSIPRTASGELPVYSKVRNGGGWRTIIRKVDGDVRALQSELNTYLRQATIDPLRAPPAAVMRTTNRHLEIRGKWVPDVKEWLEARGF